MISYPTPKYPLLVIRKAQGPPDPTGQGREMTGRFLTGAFSPDSPLVRVDFSFLFVSLIRMHRISIIKERII